MTLNNELSTYQLISVDGHMFLKASSVMENLAARLQVALECFDCCRTTDSSSLAGRAHSLTRRASSLILFFDTLHTLQS